MRSTMGCHTIARLPDVTEEEFTRRMREEVLLAVPIPPLNRVTNVAAQELLKDEMGGEADTYLWTIHWDGLERPDLVREGCEEMYEGIREKLELLGTRLSLTVAPIEGAGPTQLITRYARIGDRWEPQPEAV
jgi:hypothetical protein